MDLCPVNINLDPLSYKTNKLPKFCNVCLQDWSSLFSQEPNDAVSLMPQPLWNNQFITKDGKSYWYEELSDAGLIHISDIINPNGNFKHFNNLGLPVPQIYKWLILIHTIKKDWMTFLQNNVFQSHPRFPYLSLCGLPIELEWLSNRLIKTLVKRKQEIFSGIHALQNMIQEEIIWNEAFQIIYKTTIETKLREFQFQLLHNIHVLPINSILYRWIHQGVVF